MPQIMTLMVPPAYRELMADPVYRAYAKKRPRLPLTVSHPGAWLVVAHRPPSDSGATWGTRTMDDYADAYRWVRDRVTVGVEFDDAAIVSRRKLFTPPSGFRWDRNRYSWCGRCRRPTIFRHVAKHHALRGAILTDDEPYRCYYCGAREVFAGFRDWTK